MGVGGLADQLDGDQLVPDAEGAAAATHVLERVLVVTFADNVDGRPWIKRG